MSKNHLRRVSCLPVGLLVLSLASRASEAVPGNAGIGDPLPGQVALGDHTERVTLVATELTFNPSRIYAAPGEALFIVLHNAGNAPHSLVFELPGGLAGLSKVLDPGQVGVLRLTAPSVPGDYPYYCPIGDHRQRGMQGILSVGR